MGELVAALRTDELIAPAEVELGPLMRAAKMVQVLLFFEVRGMTLPAFLADMQPQGVATRTDMEAVEEFTPHQAALAKRFRLARHDRCPQRHIIGHEPF